MKRLLVALLLAGITLPSCSVDGSPINLPTASASITSTLAQLARQKVSVRFLNRLPNGNLVPLIPEPIETLTLNRLFTQKSSDFPADQGLKQDFPFIEEGEHLLEIKLKNNDTPLRVPLVVKKPQGDQLNILVVIRFGTEGNMVQDIQIGYDQNQDLELDKNSDVYRSQNGIRYLIHHPDGSVDEWRSPFEKAPEIQESDQPLLPAGADNNNPTGDTTPPSGPEQTQEAPPLPPIEVPPLPQPPAPPSTP